MKYLALLLVSVLIFNATHCYYIVYPNGVELWVEKVEVSEVPEAIDGSSGYFQASGTSILALDACPKDTVRAGSNCAHID